MSRQERLEIFEDTRKTYETHPGLRSAAAYSRKHQILTTEDMSVTDHSGDIIYLNEARIIVSPRRSFEAAMRYRDQKVCVLNFASASNPGGGVTKGASAQEECLCRCSTLFAALDTPEMWDGFYLPHRRTGDPLHNDDCIYTPDVVIFKSDTELPELLPEKDWCTVDIITCAAPNLRPRPSNAMNPGDGEKQTQLSPKQLQELHEKRMRRVMDLAVENGAEVLILGAFGCGAFQNPPRIVANALKTVVNDYRFCFKTVEFAVYCPPINDKNYKVFLDVFC